MADSQGSCAIKQTYTRSFKLREEVGRPDGNTFFLLNRKLIFSI
jgi:hypothetical protein